MGSSDTAGRPSEARARLLGTASRIFYAEGIHAVGIDRIVAEAQVTRATLYRHFPGKDDLILTYLTEADQALRRRAEPVLELPAQDALRALSRGIADDIRSPGFRGCAFLNAAAEYPDPGHPVHRAVLEHRRWFLETATGLLGQIGPRPSGGAAARHFVMMRDGAMAAGCLGDADAVADTFVAGTEGLIRVRTTA